jgi:hypothetical protein
MSELKDWLLMLGAGDTDTAVAFPNPGSVLKKYSTLVMLGWAPTTSSMHQQPIMLMIFFMRYMIVKQHHRQHRRV